MAKDPQPDPGDAVLISNPDLPPATPARTSREAFDAIWAAKGFQIVEVVSWVNEPAGDVPPDPAATAKTARKSGDAA